MGAERPDATSLALGPSRHSISGRAQSGDRSTKQSANKLISTLVRAILPDHDKDNLIQEVQERRPKEKIPLSEEAKQKMHSQGNV